MTTLATYQIAASANDAFEGPAGAVVINSGTIQLRDAGSWGGLRFQNVLVPQGAVITAATLKVYLGGSNRGVDTDVYGQAIDTAPAFTTSTRDISNRARTTAVVTAAQLLPSGWYSFPDISTVIQEIISRAGWASGNALALILDHKSSVNLVDFAAYDGSPSSAATLSIEYRIPFQVSKGGLRGRVHLYIEDAPDWTDIVSGLAPECDEHGFGFMPIMIPLPHDQVMHYYARLQFKEVELTANGFTVFHGRIEDRAIVSSGLSLTAYGYWQAFNDGLYNGFWSRTNVNDFVPVKASDISTRAPEKFEMDKNGRLYIAPRNGEAFGTTVTPAYSVGGLTIEKPYKSLQDYAWASFSYTLVAPTTWRAELYTNDRLFTSPVAAWTLAGNGATQTGTWSGALTANSRIEFVLWCNTLTYTVSGTGSIYLEITDLRINGRAASTVYADHIVEGLIFFIVSENPSQLNASAAFVQSPGLDLPDAAWEDTPPARVLEDLLLKGDNQTPPRRWEAAVWENKTLYFQPRDDDPPEWYVDAHEITVRPSGSTLFNAVYTLFRSVDGRTVRTVTETDANSVELNGVTRTTVVRSQATTTGQAHAERDAKLEDSKTAVPKAALRVKRLYTKNGAEVDLWRLRPGHRLTIRNLPPTSNGELDRMTSFIVARTRLLVDTAELEPIPESPPDELAFLLAQE